MLNMQVLIFGPKDELLKCNHSNESYWATVLSCGTSTSTSTSTLFQKTIGYNRLARKIAIANLGGPVKRKINWKEKKGKEKEGKLQF